MLLVLIILSILLFIISQITWRSTIRSGISPTALYALIWGTIWFVHWANFMYYRPLSDRALIYSAIPLIAIFMAESLALASSGPIVPKDWVFRCDVLRRWALRCGMLTLFAGAVTFAASWMTFGNVLTHANALKIDRVTEGLSMFAGSPLALPAKYSSILLGAYFPAVVLGTLYMRLVNRKGWWLIVLPFGGTVLYDLSWGSRVHIFDMLILFIMVNVFLPLPDSAGQWQRFAIKFKRKVRKSGKLLAVIILAGGIFAMNIIGEKTRETKTLFVGDLELPMSVLQVIDYNIGMLIGFDNTLDDTMERTWGRVSFFGFEQWLRLLRIIPRSIPIPEQLYDWEQQYLEYQTDFYRSRSGNVFTWLRYLYSDFGIFGLIIIPFFVSWLATRSLVRAVSRPRGLAALMFACIWYFIILRSPAIVRFRNEWFVFALFIIWYTGKQIVRPARMLKSPIAEEKKVT